MGTGGRSAARPDRAVLALFGLTGVLLLVLSISVLPGVRQQSGVVAVYDDWLQPAGFVLAAVLACWRVVIDPRHRLVWGWMAAALALRAYGFLHTIFVIDRAPIYPSPADLAWVASGIALLVALLAAARAQAPRRSRTLALDALLGGVTAAAVTSSALFRTLQRLAPAGAPRDVVLVNLAYPLIDVALLVVVAGLLAATRLHVSRATAAICVGVLLFAVVDVVFLYLVTVGSFRPGTVLTPLSLAASVVLAAAAWLPERPSVEDPDPRTGLGLPIGLVLVCVGVMVADAAVTIPATGIVLASVGVLIAVVRAVITYSVDRRASQQVIAGKDEEIGRYQALIEASSELIGIATMEGRVVYLNPAGRTLLGLPRTGPLRPFRIAEALTPDAARRQAEVERPQLLATGSWHGESTLLRPETGEAVPVEKNTFVIRDAGGEPWLIGTIMRDITEQVVARDQLQHFADERQELLGHLVEAQEVERARIAADVHDDPVQVMAAVDLQLGLVERRLEAGGDPAQTQEMVARMRHTVGQANDRLRYLLFDLDSPAQRTDLESALGEAAAFVLGDSVRWEVRCPLGLELPENARVLAYRVAKEALINIRKHARAHRVVVEVERQDGRGLQVTVTDDGVGLPADGVVARPGHRGLLDMRDRAAIAGGQVTLEPGEDSGAVVRLWIPEEPGRIS